MIPKPEWMMVPPILTADNPADPSKKKLLVYQGPYNDKAMFLIWGYILLSPNENYLSFHCLKEIGALV